MTQWYRWTTLEAAQACLNYINAHPKLPINNGAGKQQTERWCDSVTECTDGLFGFPRITEEWLTALGISGGEVDAFYAAFNPQVHDYDPAWFPEVEI